MRSSAVLDPSTLVVVLLVAPKFTSDVACCAFSFQSTAPTTVFSTYWMMVPPPGEPVAMRKSPGAVPLNTRVGAMVLRGRLPGATRLATGVPELSAGWAEKSVSWLVSRKPPTMWKEPMLDSTVEVMDSTLP